MSVMLFRGVINSVTNKGTLSCPIVHCYTAVGHSKAVLSLFAVDELLFTGSKGTSARMHFAIERLYCFMTT